MPVVDFTAASDLEGYLQAALVESVEAIGEALSSGISSPLFTDAEEMFASVCLEYTTAMTLARAGWWVSQEMPLWWTEIVTEDIDCLKEADSFLRDRHLREGMVCTFYGRDETRPLLLRLVLLSEDKKLSAQFRMLFDH